jgi:ABC-type uncharacterized transport system ATPase subunit
MVCAQKKQRGTSIMLCEKELKFNNQLEGPPDFKASRGWLRNFKVHTTYDNLRFKENLYLAMQLKMLKKHC